MSVVLALPLIGLLLAFPGLPHIPGLPGAGLKELKKLRQGKAALLDSLPPAWRPASRLALENQFVRAVLRPVGPAPVGLKLNPDPRKVDVSFDPDSGVVRYATEFEDVPVGQAARLPVQQFAHDLTRRNFERMWYDRTMLSLRQAAAQAATAQGGLGATSSGTGFKFELPSPLPKRFQGLLGPGGPSLTVSGSENIRLSGQSNWTNQQINVLGQRNSLFPSLDMQQDLNIRLEGRLSDRVGVNLLQNSANQIPLANRVAINYAGDEDDLVQSLDLGNTNLTLPGTQYVSYSGKNEGLFGMKATTRFGPLDYTLLASKQEGRSERASYSGGSSQQIQYLQDKDYVHGVYFFFYDPSAVTSGPFGFDVRAINESTVRLYLNEGSSINQVNTVRGRAFVDPEQACRDSALCPDGPDLDTYPDTTRAVHGTWRLLKPGADQDYEILSNVYGPFFKVIRLHSALSSDEKSLAVVYAYSHVVPGPNGTAVSAGDSVHVGGLFETVQADSGKALTMKLIRAPETELAVDPSGVYLPFDPKNSPFIATRELELKNFYQLSGQRLDPKTVQISIRQGDDVPARTLAKDGVSYIQALGLDNYDETGTVDRTKHGHDDVVDGTSPNNDYANFVDFEHGTLWLPDIRPFAPRLEADASGGRAFDRFISSLLFRSDSLVGAPNFSDAANPIIYQKRSLLSEDRLYTIEVHFTAATAGNEITLGRTNIIEGSDVVTASGRTLQRDVDYRIDYDLGKITMIHPLRPEDQLNIDYSYAPLFQQAGKTLLGNAFRWEGRDRNFGGAFLYESKGAQDLRPRIGEEPSRSLIGDLNTEWKMRPFFLTRAVDMLPGVRTSQPSELNVQAELGASFPNPNTRNELFLDDMEGVRDAVTLSMNPERWRWSSLPIRKSGTVEVNVDQTTDDPQKNAEVHWYSPLNAVKERDLKPSLTQAQGSQNTHQVLAISIPRRPTPLTSTFDPLWVGLTQPIDNVGLDLSRSQFIELWVDDFRDFHNGIHVDRVRGRHVKLHVDIGAVDEDEQRSPDVPPNGVLDSEDVPHQGAPRDGKLQASSDNNEDTGLDNRLDDDPNGEGPVLDLKTASSTDPQGDDFSLPSSSFDDLDPRKWLFTNGTEGDKNVVPVPETEDLNANGGFDRGNNYFEYTVVLGDTAGCDSCKRYLVSDIHDAFPGGYADPPQGVVGMPDDNGWRRYRIPITDSLRVAIGSPDLTLARHVRIWLEDIVETDPPPLRDPNGSDKGDGRPFVMIGGLEIVGSRWLAAPLDSPSLEAGTKMTLNTVNTIDQADIYVPPFDPGKTRSGSQELTRREQALSLEFTDFGPADTLEAYKTFSIDEDYTRYGSLDWFAAAFDISPIYNQATDSLDYYMRFSSDERGLNYYEYRARLPRSSLPGAINWNEVRLQLTKLSNLKLNSDFPNNAGDILYRAPGAVPGEQYVIKGRPSFTRLRRISFGLINASSRTFSGQAWLDELRAIDVAKDQGNAKRVSVNGRLANLAGYSVTWNTRDANFQSVGESRGTGSSNDNLNFNTTMDLHRFIEGTKIVLPFSYTYSGNRIAPRFTAGDDVVRTGVLAEASDSKSTSQAWSLGYSRQWGERTNPFLKYTLAGLNANYERNWSDSRNPTNVSSGKNDLLQVSYNISPRQALALRLPATGIKFFPLPERFYWNYNLSNNASTVFDRQRDSLGTLALRNATKGNNASIDFGADTRPFDFFHHGFQATRNLSLPSALRENVGALNLGRVVSWRQTMDSRMALQKYGPWLRPTVSWRSSYTQNNGPELSADMSQRQVSNGQGINLDWELPFDRLVTRAPGLPGPSSPGRPGVPRPPTQAADSTHRAQQSPLWRRLFARLGSIGTNATYNAQNSQSRLTGTPSLMYLTGVSNRFGRGGGGTGAVPVFGNNSSDHNEFRVASHTALDLGLGMILSTRGDLSTQANDQNGVESRRSQIRFPDLDLSYGRLTSLIGMDKVLQNSHIKTHYGRSQSVDYTNQSSDPTSVSTSSEWSPLIDLGGDLKNGTRTQLTINRRVTETENRVNGLSVTTDRNTTANLSINRSYSKGQKVNVLGKETTVKSNINLGMTAAYEKQSGETVQGGGVLSPTNRDRLSVNAQGGYSFSNNVTGNVEIGYGQNRDLVLRSVTRSLRLELRAQFTF